MPTNFNKSLKESFFNPQDGVSSSDECLRKTPKELSYGEKLVGLTFNPSGDDKVNKAKRLCADLADLLYEECKNRESGEFGSILYTHTIGEILNAQMNVVKVLTLKY